MDKKRHEFLTTMVTILGRLSETSTSKGEPLLASMLALARKEAEDALRHACDLDRLAAERAEHSAMHSWRACDRDVAVAAEVPQAAEQAA
jgi:hypothetical protein